MLALGGVLAASPASAAVICVPSLGIHGSCGVPAASIGAGIALASVGGGDVVLVGPGTYTEFVTIDRSVSLRSTTGRAATIIAPPATPTANLGTIRLSPGMNGVEIGGPAGGFTIHGVDDLSPGIESATVYLQGNHSLVTVRDNEIVAAGDAGFQTEFGATVSGLVFQGGSFGLCLPGDSTGNVATCNRITGHDDLPYDVGVSADAAASTVRDDAIAGNATGIDGSAITSGMLDAADNWWGCATGPNTAGCDPTVGAVAATPFRSAIPPCLACSADAECDDGLICTGSETCQAGTCTAGTPVDCTEAGDQCNVGACLEPAGACVAVPKPNGTVCTSGSACSLPDSCQGGVCLAGGVRRRRRRHRLRSRRQLSARPEPRSAQHRRGGRRRRVRSVGRSPQSDAPAAEGHPAAGRTRTARSG
ncbi:MAG: hypothetical protein KIT14_11690 [bacterium]|nr:hypothetical protein [bacterium]